MDNPLLFACIPNSPDFSHPQDRRRYVSFLNDMGIKLEIANYSKDYDIVYITLRADLNQWSNYKQKQSNYNKDVRIIFDLSDLYLVDDKIKDYFRSVYHFFSGRTSSLKLSYSKTVLKMIYSTDVLICGSYEQKVILNKFHDNVVIVRDYFGQDITVKKASYRLSSNKELNILWEGYSHGNVEIFQMLKQILNSVDGYKINLHVITDPKYCKLGGKHFCIPTYSLLKEVFSKSNVNFLLYDWNALTFSSIAIMCDFALIPIPNNPIMQYKPENKLLLLWSLGIPVIASETKSYKRVMHSINEEFVCNTIEDWKIKISNIASSQEIREKYMKSVEHYLLEHCSFESIKKTWNTIINSRKIKE